MVGKVTVDPRERATPVADPAIIEARSRRNGRLIDAKRVIGSFDYAAAIRLRGVLNDAGSRGRPRLVCSNCGVTLFPASSARAGVSR
ncbi:hypothetical protein [Sphingomonas sp. AX6]|uniref:hypothetical protein n=1 Tax=Sphingomonas sp. AX6 TaxID=2653171 RepID=UPI0012F3944A|nr:hypothetical protein [Sphingomonas sp. AX6]VXC96260.1 hypothetical protein SPHINGOAX6_70605 [Sphingomonas sp. AX6]